MGFFKSGYQSDDDKKRLKAIKKIKDENLLEQILINENNLDILKLLCDKLPVEKVIKCIIKLGENYHARIIGDILLEKNKKLTDDPQLLFDLAMASKYDHSFAALGLISDSTTLAKIAKNHSEQHVAVSAIEKITDQSILFDIVKNNKKIEHYFSVNQSIIASKLDKKACLYGAIKRGLDRIEERIIEVW